MTHESPARHLVLVDDAPMTDMSGFADWLRANGCAISTVHYRLAHLADFERHHPNFPNVTRAEITAWLGRPGYAPWSRATFYGHLRSYFGWAAEEAELVAVDPMTKMHRPHVPKGSPRPLTSEQVDLILASATSARQHAWLILALFSGLRAFEIAKIRGQDVQEDRMFVCGKGGRSAYVPTHAAVWALASTMPRHGWWFPSSSEAGHVSARHVSARTCTLLAANGIEGGIHRGRHTFATRLLREGANIRVVQNLMRHEFLASTEVYLAVDDAECRAAIDLLAA